MYGFCILNVDYQPWAELFGMSNKFSLLQIIITGSGAHITSYSINIAEGRGTG
jgi:hypothetical protein